MNLKNHQNFKLYSHSNSLSFANKLSKSILGGELLPEVHQCTLQKFADGELNVIFNESVRDKSLIIVAQIEMPYEKMFELFLMLDAAKRSGAKDITLIIPYLPHSRQERRDDKRSPITARIVADMLQNAGADRIISMDLHTSAIEGLYKIPFDKLYPVDIFVNEIRILESRFNMQNLGLVSPDFGFMKKMEKYQEILQCNMSVINKHRLKANEITKMELIGNVEGQNVIIIDDIIDTGGTLIKAADLLLEKGAIDVHVFATHAILSGDAVKRLQDSRIKTINISNTIDRNISVPSFFTGGTHVDGSPIEAPEALLLKQPIKKFNVIDVSPVFASALSKITE